MTTQLPELPSKERLEALASGNAFTCVQDDEATAMARALLAGMEQEPVAFTCEDAIADVHIGKTCPMGPKGEIGDEPLYAAPVVSQPAPVAVPDEITPAKRPDHWQKYGWEERAYAEGWNACRAAIINGGKS